VKKDAEIVGADIQKDVAKMGSYAATLVQQWGLN